MEDGLAWTFLRYDDSPTQGRLDLHITKRIADGDDGVRFFLVSRNGLIVASHVNIYLYHIPGSRAAENYSNLYPVWSWQGEKDPSGYRGTIYKTASPYPALWLQGWQVTHTLEFDMDESGFPTVVNHHITEEQPAYYVGSHLKLQGRKVMSIDTKQGGEIVLNTGVLGKPDITRELRAKLPGLYDGRWYQQDRMKYTDLDEATGRIMIVVGQVPGPRWRQNKWLCIADLPI